MGQFSVEISGLPGSVLSGNQHLVIAQRNRAADGDDPGHSAAGFDKVFLLVEDLAPGADLERRGPDLTVLGHGGGAEAERL